MSDFEEKDINEIPKEEIPKTADTPVDDFAKDYVIEDESEEAPKAEVLKDEPKKKKGGKTLLILLLVFLLLAGAFAAWYFFFRPAVKFTSSRPIAEAGEEFEPMSIVEDVQGGDISEVSVFGPKGPLAKGVYKYTYKFKNKDFEVSVTVRDTKAPVLKLKDGSEDPNSSIVAYPIFTDRDTVDPGRIVDAEDYGKVTLTIDPQGNDLKVPGMYEIVVKAVDEDKNESSINAKIEIVPYDTEPPTITGADDVSIENGTSFDVMSGVAVKDDKDPSPTILVTANDLNTSVDNTYTVSYEAKDSYGNVTKKDRYITVYTPSPTPWYVPGNDSSVGWDATGEWGQPYLVAVNRAHNTVTVYGQDGNGNYTVPVKACPCSTAREGYNTPISTNVWGGRFHSAWRADWCYMVDGSWGRYAISIDTTLAPDPYDQWGIMFHSVCYYSQSTDENGVYNDIEYDEYNKLGGVASLGCIRLCVADELWLYNNCPEGFPIIIYDDWSSPGPLGKPDPIRIDTGDWRKGIDPTDPNPNNPW